MQNNKIEVKESFLKPNKYTRPQTKLKAVRGIVLHWVENPFISKAEKIKTWWRIMNESKYVLQRANKKMKTKMKREQFSDDEYLKVLASNSIYASTHFVIGKKGEIINTIPVDEVAYQCGLSSKSPLRVPELTRRPNSYILGIELCHKNWKGEFTNETYDSAIQLVAYLLKKNGLSQENIYTHYNITGKKCPKYFVNNPLEFKKFKNLVGGLI